MKARQAAAVKIPSAGGSGRNLLSLFALVAQQGADQRREGPETAERLHISTPRKPSLLPPSPSLLLRSITFRPICR